MGDGPDRESLVVRLRPINPQAMLDSAAKAYRDQGYYRLSVFADKARDGENWDELIARLLDAAEVSGILRTRNPKYWFCQRAAPLLDDDGFVFVKDGYEGEVPEHWSIDLGNAPTVEDTRRLAAHFPESRDWEQEQ